MEGPITQNKFTIANNNNNNDFAQLMRSFFGLNTFSIDTVLPSPDGVGDGLDVPGADVQGGSPEQPHLCPGLEVPHDALVA